uniref:Uncharacterized protein n=1 Tax=Babesia bovis TaxID=5865 RepID=S6BK32_BABBO|nr:hypothetical protein [Babesia bovis]
MAVSSTAVKLGPIGTETVIGLFWGAGVYTPFRAPGFICSLNVVAPNCAGS